MGKLIIYIAIFQFANCLSLPGWVCFCIPEKLCQEWKDAECVCVLVRHGLRGGALKNHMTERSLDLDALQTSQRRKISMLQIPLVHPSARWVENVEALIQED